MLETGPDDQGGALAHRSGLTRKPPPGQVRRQGAFTQYQPPWSKIGAEMMSLRLTWPAKALGLAGLAFALAACASAPAPISATAVSAPRLDLPYEPSAPPQVADYAARLQCVPFARRASGVEIYGNANTWWRQAEGRYPRSNSPAPGSVFVLRGHNTPHRGHVAVVKEIVSNRVIRVDHANWLNGGEISVNVPVMDVSAANDWSEVRVWHIPGGHWGGRTYSAEGFIHPFTMHAATS
ncbi:MAG TPA: CHAP domain-containing protein [Vitreimonas sp.]|nr:CHAP domain-containing protein [Vitreimonas sp.]